MNKRLNRCFSLFVCDVQKKLVFNTFNKNIIKNINFLLKSSYQFPNFNNRQIAIFKPEYFDNCYNIGFDDDLLNKKEIFVKNTYSMFNIQLNNELLKKNISDIILTGIETQWCITHTAMDLLENDYKVHIPVDCVSSQSKFEHDIALKRLFQMGCYPCTSNGIVSEMLHNINDNVSKWYVEYYKIYMNNI